MNKTILLSLVLSLCCAACGNNANNSPEQDSTPDASDATLDFSDSSKMDTPPDVLTDEGTDQQKDEAKDQPVDQQEDEQLDEGGTTQFDDPEDVLLRVSQATAETICSALFDCQGEASFLLLFIGLDRYPDKAACLAANTTPQSQSFFAPSLESWRTGLISYDESVADVCVPLLLDSIKDVRCNSAASFVQLEQTIESTCSTLFEGKSALGEGCDEDATCASSNCDADPGSGCDVCVEAEDPDSCDGVVCQPSQFCADGDTCTTYAALGEACVETQFGESSCQLGLACQRLSGSPVCIQARSVAQGQPCSGSAECVAGTVCGEDVCRPTSEFPTPKAGDPCEYDDGFFVLEFSDCGPGLACKDVDTNTNQGTCATYSLQGEACERSTECAKGTYCNAQTNMCQADKLPDGVACVFEEECAGGSCSFDDVCASLAQPGEACASNQACASGSCDAGVCVASTCL